MIPETTSREPVLSWLERNALDPSKVLGPEEDASAPGAEVKVMIYPDDFLIGWVASLGFDPKDVYHVNVTGEHVEVSHYVRMPDGALVIEGLGLDFRPKVTTTKVRFA